mmetsp:Transcript_2054/g.4765  ORF Transcript_2054/g.4765 Transcript_2054/m.4765 type:complete len:205 (+) Transcript_2054:252-866(+)|eukprot:CAMPEP_0177647056 /NCGR_PEP_ID=MMETSP0447-20121125/10102_1 /TAXON_ID=0 /ORGANISM="Stygamoeba regulata, Strain BSH-02190019" /LENGTH=204 /DNA_ID=CAMNT_0019149627 /DNA_START=101 /DNA_END=715 /DNA_ORIENTATION=-
MASSSTTPPADQTFKLLIIGDSGVGKSSILLRFTDDEFEEDHPCTIGVDFKIKPMTFQGQSINLTIWDTAGQEKFRSLTSSYYRGTHGIVLVYDVSVRESFQHLSTWLEEVDVFATNPNVVKLLVGNKIDKADRAVSEEEAHAFARQHAMVYIECSAKTKKGIQQTFEEIVAKIMENPALYARASQSTVSPGGAARPTEQGCCW